MSGRTSDTSCCICIESHEVFTIWVSVDPAEIRSDLIPYWSLHCWSWTAVSTIRTRPATHRFHSIECGFGGSTQTLKSIYIVVAYSRRLFVLAPSFLVAYSSELRSFCLNFRSFLNILIRYIWNESTQAILFRESPCLSNSSFWTLVFHINGRFIYAIFSYSWNMIVSESLKNHSVTSWSGKSVSWWTLRNGLKRSMIRVFEIV